MAEAKLDLLHEAIARNAAAVLSLPSAGLLRHCKSRFLAEAPNGFWIESDPHQRILLDELIEKKSRVGMAFKTGTERIIFAAPILLRDPNYSLNRQVTLETLLLAFPEQLTSVQRRANYRVVIPGNASVTVRVWKVPKQWNLRDRPPASAEVFAKVRDLSTGGIGLLCPPNNGQPVSMARDCRLRIAIKRDDVQITVEGYAKHAQVTPDNSIRVGVQFGKLQDDLEGRQILSKITSLVGQLQREEVRRLHLGLTA